MRSHAPRVRTSSSSPSHESSGRTVIGASLLSWSSPQRHYRRQPWRVPASQPQHPNFPQAYPHIAEFRFVRRLQVDPHALRLFHVSASRISVRSHRISPLPARTLLTPNPDETCPAAEQKQQPIPHKQMQKPEILNQDSACVNSKPYHLLRRPTVVNV